MTIRLISSGIVRSRERSPASTCATRTGGDAFAATTEHASVEFTSPTTTTQSGRSSARTFSNASMMRAVWTAWVAEPTPRWMSGGGISRSWKKTSDIRSS